MRTQYEKPLDIENENYFKKRYEKFYSNRVLLKVSKAYGVDFFIFENNKYIGILEYKKRNMTWGMYDSLYLPLQKLISMKNIISSIGGTAIFAIDDSNNTPKYTDNFDNCSIQWAGRTNSPRDNFDIEPIVHIPLTRFVSFKKE
jgi:hypothetical protein